MATIRVEPSGSQWVVTKNGRTQSHHRLKRRAVEAAQRLGGPGDTLNIRRSNGTNQDWRSL